MNVLKNISKQFPERDHGLALFVEVVILYVLCVLELKVQLKCPTVGDKAVLPGPVGDRVWRGAGGRAAVEPQLAGSRTEALVGNTAAGVCAERNPRHVPQLPLHNQGHHLQGRRDKGVIERNKISGKKKQFER